MAISRKEYMKQYNQLETVKQSKRKWKKINSCTIEYKLKRRFSDTLHKMNCFFIYSDGNMKCNKCGFDDVDALTIDHINNNGNDERKNIYKCSGTGFFRWLTRNNYPDGYQVLCRNCNWIKHINGGV